MANVEEAKPDAEKIWTWRRQLTGNILPLIPGLPFLVIGFYTMCHQQKFLGWGLLIFSLGVATTWISLNWLACYASRGLQLEFDIWYQSKIAELPKERYFVGFAQPNYSGILDPHQDIGFLALGESNLIFLGEKFHLSFPKSTIKEVKFKWNPHSIVGLGRWICVQGTSDSMDFHLKIEPRSESTLLADKRASSILRNRIQNWAANKN